ncbi:MAG: peptidoglycan-binding protein [Rhodospirillales bacterium]|nr:peptidoglycan-binding protein [Alphaproteobacteria bacterium]MCB9986382.1 peptidoglycan-binding protein [Rhodospirillales bacterium]USO07069.1 MAG: peptidoglycan-binding protein [Rhodospirillales bacterium]
MKIEIKHPFAANSPADEIDVRQIKKALNRLGYYKPYEKTGITGIPDAAIFKALEAFQKDQGLKVTGTMKPDDETSRALSNEAAKTPEGEYIWRTVGDDKVRASHAELDKTRRSWADNPDPGDDFNCRCWAEPVSTDEIDDPPIRPVYPELLLLPSLRIGKIALGPVIRVLTKIFRRAPKSNGKTTDHGSIRSKQRNISQKDIDDAIESAQKSGNVTTKTGKYGTLQKVYKGSNGVVVVLETQGRNAGKVITVWRK